MRSPLPRSLVILSQACLIFHAVDSHRAKLASSLCRVICLGIKWDCEDRACSPISSVAFWGLSLWPSPFRATSTAVPHLHVRSSINGKRCSGHVNLGSHCKIVLVSCSSFRILFLVQPGTAVTNDTIIKVVKSGRIIASRDDKKRPMSGTAKCLFQDTYVCNPSACSMISGYTTTKWITHKSHRAQAFNEFLYTVGTSTNSLPPTQCTYSKVHFLVHREDWPAFRRARTMWTWACSTSE